MSVIQPRVLHSEMGINKLPPDILLDILRDAFNPDARPLRIDLNYFSADNAPCEQGTAYIPGEDDFAGESLMPEGFASVCSYWREVMSNAAVFWTSFVIWIGRDPTPLSQLREYLAWSGDYPLDIFVLRRYDPSIHDPTENARMQAIFALLSPHMRRWRVLSVKCLYASSLPRPRFELVGHADQLYRLNLDSLVDDLPPELSPPPSPAGDLDCPQLQRLSINGAAFRAAYIAPRANLPLPPQALTRIQLTDYSAHQPSFPLADLLRCLASCSMLRIIILTNLHLECDARSPPLDYFQLAVPEVVFADMSGNAVAEHSRLLGETIVQCVTLARCTTSDTREHWQLVRSQYLTLEELDADTVSYYLRRAPGSPSCETLSLTRCGLRPDVLRVLGRPLVPDEDEDGRARWACPHMDNLLITDAPLIGSADVRAVLQPRLMAHYRAGLGGILNPAFTVTSVVDLRVYGCGPLAEEDKVWFDAHVTRVVWDGWQGGLSRAR